MAKEQKENIAIENAGNKEIKKRQESLYTIEEFSQNSEILFKAKPECVMAALRVGGKENYTLSEAKEIVEKFLKKEVS